MKKYKIHPICKSSVSEEEGNPKNITPVRERRETVYRKTRLRREEETRKVANKVFVEWNLGDKKPKSKRNKEDNGDGGKTKCCVIL